MAGRKPIYDTESLEIGEKLNIPYRLKNFKDQYLYNFRSRNKDKDFKIVEEDKKLFVERIAWVKTKNNEKLKDQKKIADKKRKQYLKLLTAAQAFGGTETG